MLSITNMLIHVHVFFLQGLTLKCVLPDRYKKTKQNRNTQKTSTLGILFSKTLFILDKILKMGLLGMFFVVFSWVFLSGWQTSLSDMYNVYADHPSINDAAQLCSLMVSYVYS